MNLLRWIVLLLLIPFTTALAREPLAQKVEHLVITSPRAQVVFDFMTQELKLPAIWPYSDYGSFASGGISLGNLVLEISHGARGATHFSGLALESALDAEALTQALPERGIGSTGPQPYSVNVDGKTLVLWTNVSLPGFEPRGAAVFFTDYTNKKAYRTNRKQGASALRAARGGLLGVYRAKLISLGIQDRTRALRGWRMLASDLAGDLLRFSAGPPLRLVFGQSAPGILSLSLQMRSRLQAEQILRARGWLGVAEDGGSLLAAPALRGLRIRIEE